MKEVKQQLFSHCQLWIDEKVELAQNAIRMAQEAANEETKSSAGDKYETARAMAQLEIEKSSIQLSEAIKLKRLLNEFSSESYSHNARLGSLIKTDNGWFYISVSLGKVTLNDVIYICLSPVSPLGAKMMGLKSGDSFHFNKQDFKVIEIY